MWEVLFKLTEETFAKEGSINRCRSKKHKGSLTLSCYKADILFDCGLEYNFSAHVQVGVFQR